MITLYAIPNCDTVKKARAWLDARGIAYVFHDYKKAGADAGQLERWSGVFGWDRVMNRAGMSYRKLSDADKDGLDGPRAIALMVANPSLIKRPIVEYAGGLLLGFVEGEWETALSGH
jgi:arsenate reductase (glutaredoxin)